ncbi:MULTISPECIES: ABC transporter ATP-binding protein/permease [Legionella]|uniref:ABC transporter n=1 Tax=Legionella steelei TaxID=947033 RepID=A0A0W0ZI70_9GAMM|nr:MULTISPECIES: SbmA/BacA-like family transporter [Legionella]KTD68515.1 ABC transporter [Legionella steelei]OJW05951.1 MAG: ABC transporter [Legionella sp. 39-23]
MDLSSRKKAFQLFSDYFINSDQKLTAWLLLGGIFLSIIAIVAITAFLPWGFLGFWAALTAKELTGFLFYSGAIALTSAVIIGMSSLMDYLTDTLSIKWRSWLTSKYINKYLFGKKNYLDLARVAPHIDNPEQRIQKNIKGFVDHTLSLSTEFFRSTLSLAIFIGTLWVIGGTLTIVVFGANLVIPGYLVWASLGVALINSVITHMLGKSLTAINQKEDLLEAKLRKDLEFIHNESENIALEGGEHYHQKILENDIEQVSQNAFQKMWVNLKVSAFQMCNSYLADILPYLFAAPAYFSGLIDFGQIAQIGMSFNEVNKAFNWFVDSYTELQKYQSSIERIAQLEEELDNERREINPKNIHIHESQTTTLAVKNLTLAYPRASKPGHMMRNLNLEFKPGENTLIKAPSGFGKSTFFKAARRTWGYGTGEISIPQHQKTYFLPQKPLIPHDTLKAILAYPDPVSTYVDDQYKAVLCAVGGKMEQFIAELDQEDAWSTRLSLGQQQRISFARALLKKPDWLFLDEATASLDEESEAHLYRLLKEKLPHTTVISIAHRSTVMKFHQRVVSFEPSSEEIQQQSSLGRSI